MFGFSKEEKLSTEIGRFLHRNIREALFVNEEVAGVRVNDIFTSAYIYSFITSLAEHRGLDGEKFRDRNLKYICDGVLPKKLYESIIRNSAAIELLEGQSNDMAVAQKKLFLQGIKKGEEDAFSFNIKNDPEMTAWLYFYLYDHRDEDGLGILDEKPPSDSTERQQESVEEEIYSQNASEETELGDEYDFSLAPDLGDTEKYPAKIIKKHREVGEAIRSGDLLVTVESEKAVMDIASQYSGRIHKFDRQVGDIVRSHSVIAIINSGEEESDQDLESRLSKLKELEERGLISSSEAEAKRAELLSTL